MHRHLQHFIDGVWGDSDGGRPHAVIDPATEQPVTEIALGSEADVDRAVAAARRAFEDYARTDVETRAALLDRIADGMKARTADLAKAISEEMGAPIAFAAGGQASSR
jgi:aldehyde dehydrogenase (NAD+)